MRTNKFIIVLDGDCAVCSWGAKVIARHDKADLFRILPAQTERGKRLLTENGINWRDPESWLVQGPDGTTWTHSSAVIAVGRKLSGVWPWLAYLLLVFPRQLRDIGYRVFARNRYRLFGTADLCSIPNENLRRRLLSE